MAGENKNLADAVFDPQFRDGQPTNKKLSSGVSGQYQFGKDLVTVKDGVKVGSELVDTITNQNNTGVVSGTDDARDTRSDELNAYIKDLKTSGASLTGGFSDVESMNEIERARESARLATQGMVDESIESRRVTLPSDIVRAGQRGGFESTQQAGIAALKATDGKVGESFVGAGGQLDESRQRLDKAVIAAKAAQQAAMARAESAAREAITSRRQKDYDVARDLYNVANDAAKYADTVERDKRDFDQKIEEYTAREERAVSQEERAIEAGEREVTRFNQENEDRIAQASASTLLSLDAQGNVVMPTFEEIQKLAEANQVSPEVLTTFINQRAEELRKVGSDQRAEKLAQDKFEETKEQNKLQNERANRGLALESGRLALSQKQYADKKLAEDDDLTGSEKLMKNIANVADDLIALSGSEPGDIISNEQITAQASTIAEQTGYPVETVVTALTNSVNEKLGITDDELEGTGEYFMDFDEEKGMAGEKRISWDVNTGGRKGKDITVSISGAGLPRGWKFNESGTLIDNKGMIVLDKGGQVVKR